MLRVTGGAELNDWSKRINERVRDSVDGSEDVHDSGRTKCRVANDGGNDGLALEAVVGV